MKRINPVNSKLLSRFSVDVTLAVLNFVPSNEEVREIDPHPNNLFALPQYPCVPTLQMNKQMKNDTTRGWRLLWWLVIPDCKTLPGGDG
uniref:Uncharacterized protein n=2 Tax=Picea TaxID=3328 RepID=A0A101LXT3_PICGL|nr:hypothetical protein ABT39_MTgene5491 [Picea glauca]QHR91555.1 hypothetical protein Q903MT_gene5590 [Picea sitchensis]